MFVEIEFIADNCGTKEAFLLFKMASIFVLSAKGDCRLNDKAGLADGLIGCCGRRISDGNMFV